MKFAFLGLIVLAAELPYATAGEVAGTWEGTLTNGTNAFYAGFDLDVDGDKIKGVAIVEGWGYSTVSDGRVDGDRFRFIVNRKSGVSGPLSKIVFSGTVTGKSMAVGMTYGTRYESTLRRVESQVTGPLSVDAPPNELDGKWTAKFVGRLGDRPKMIGRIDLDFQVSGNTLTGMAHMEGWPGDCPISVGRVANGRFSFTATGLSPSSTGIPVMRFRGEIHGKQLKLTMRHQIFGSDNGVALPMDAIRM